MDPQEWPQDDGTPGGKLDAGQKAAIVIWTEKEAQFELGKSFCDVNHKKKKCKHGRVRTKEELIQKYYRNKFPEFVEKWVIHNLCNIG